ncbi:MAG: DUF3078 domain-containing protein [Chlorobi bacterium]|nr:DUF3078 domain-containing protein [Chlorobiota bacterium]
MKRSIVVLLFFLISLNAYAQTDSAKTSNWTIKGIVGFNLNQTSFTNWAKGGDNAFAFSLVGDFNADYASDGWKFTNYLKLNWGRSKIGVDETKVTDNEFVLENLLAKNVGWVFKPYFSNTIRTQLVAGYDYAEEPAVEVAAFFDPGYVTQELGLIYDAPEWFQTRLGLGFKHSITNKFNDASDDKETPDIEKYKFDAGIQSVTEASFGIVENVVYNTKLSLFGRFKDFAWWDVYWDNKFVAKINNFMNVNLDVSVVYNRDETIETQVKEAFQLGFSFAIF